MMELSEEVNEMLAKVRQLLKENQELNCADRCSPRNISSTYIPDDIKKDLIDVDNIKFYNDETWLYSSKKNNEVRDLKGWLYEGFGSNNSNSNINLKSDVLSTIPAINCTSTPRKNIDSRTFTRPKKRLNRPSIEHYNEGYFKMDKSATLSDHIEDESNLLQVSSDFNRVIGYSAASPRSFGTSYSSEISLSQGPLHFDLSQPTTSSIFDKVALSTSDLDSFQNMSPPSLVNSMCSSTFTNIMDSSFIKNDPTLREIRDAEPTDAMLQDYEQVTFTDSCSSLGSDATEAFLKQAEADFSKENISLSKSNEYSSLNDTYTTESSTTVIMDCYEKDISGDFNSTFICDKNETQTLHLDQTFTNGNKTVCKSTPTILNGTFKKDSSAKSNTFNNLFHCKSDELLNDDMNRTVTLVDSSVDSNRFNNTKRHSYILQRERNDSNSSANTKHNSFGCLTGSTDSLDHMSSISGSSKGSNRMLNMAEIDALVLQQEQSLPQVVSTPRCPNNKAVSKLWENSGISPIVPLDRGDHLSDSSDDYLTVGSGDSSETRSYSPKSYKPVNLDNLEVTKNNLRSRNVITTKKPYTKKSEINLRSSYLTGQNANLRGSYGNLRQPNNVRGSYSSLSTAVRGSYSNLKMMNSNLKSSYTQLKPVLTNLPCADTNLKAFDATIVKTKSQFERNIGDKKIAEVAPTIRGQVKTVASVANCNANSQVKISGLPRPISALPRPISSKIPGPPRNDRPSNQSRRCFSRPVSNVNVHSNF